MEDKGNWPNLFKSYPLASNPYTVSMMAPHMIINKLPRRLNFIIDKMKAMRLLILGRIKCLNV